MDAILALSLLPSRMALSLSLRWWISPQTTKIAKEEEEEEANHSNVRIVNDVMGTPSPIDNLSFLLSFPPSPLGN